MSKKFKFIPYNCGAGASLSGCEMGASVLKETIFSDNLWEEFYYNPEHDESLGTPQSSKERIRVIEDCCKKIASDVERAINDGYVPVTIGGDHSMAIGSVAGLAKAKKSSGKTGLLWVDAHLDGHVFDTSPSKAIHGMSVAHLLGYGFDELVNIIDDVPVISPEHLCLIGGRSFEEGESDLYRKLGVKLFLMDDIRCRGIENVVDEALKIVTKGTECHFLSIDTDVFDPDIAPAVGSPESGGINKNDMVVMLKKLRDANFDAIEIAEYNPKMGKNDGITRTLIKDIWNILS